VAKHPFQGRAISGVSWIYRIPMAIVGMRLTAPGW
jgi:hypothetical protein